MNMSNPYYYNPLQLRDSNAGGSYPYLDYGKMVDPNRPDYPGGGMATPVGPSYRDYAQERSQQMAGSAAAARGQGMAVQEAKRQDFATKLPGAISAGLGLVSEFAGNAATRDLLSDYGQRVQTEEDRIRALRDRPIDPLGAAPTLSQYSTPAIEFKNSPATGLSNVASMTAAGASAGSLAGPWGTLIGAGTGALMGIMTSLFGRKRRREETEAINARNAEMANSAYQQALADYTVKQRNYVARKQEAQTEQSRLEQKADRLRAEARDLQQGTQNLMAGKALVQQGSSPAERMSHIPADLLGGYSNVQLLR